MPIYEFVCESCGRVVERLQKVSDPPPDACPECGGKMAKIMSRNSFQLKGGGWYRDLYSSSGRKGDAAGTSSGNSGPAGGSAPADSSGKSGPAGDSGAAKKAPAPQPSSAPTTAPASSSPKKD
jgi:putative FmdB family regulatory protein